MNALKNLSLILLLSLAFTGCHNKSSKINDFNLLLYAPEYASGFDIKGAGGKESVLITVRNPWQGADSVTTWLFIVRNGEEVPEGFAGQVLKGDAKRIVAMSSTHIAMLDAIGEVRCITGVSGIDYISNPDLQARRDSIGDVGYEGNINYELLLSLDPALGICEENHSPRHNQHHHRSNRCCKIRINTGNTYLGQYGGQRRKYSRQQGKHKPQSNSST